MAANAFVRARIDEAVKNEAAEVLASMGMTVSDLMRITLTKVARERALPFDMRVPNELTAKTIAASEKGIDVHKAEDADDLFNKLGI
ncbi:type II toxin-antitoxin system RelB/DinJ family antitoxin [Salmonella enterica subsp. enterica serovar Newport]|nr:type II toxin-antitoxin system antitoxin, RelB/DinJ family [Salmonella enterica subsp. enterica serovar Gombe]EJQ8147410.1 type II toxin-antitoxin system RelB/DinJ family antitoxin [Salmonella enterica subsp. enterica serovar Newport]EJW0496989.1 type II toxin-antitoxin system RelB/DinJ family antitoxin [Salmonella enterica subsp. enterica serovar Newport]ELA5318484.1 type II toxin-antitoxin system RelB/DinJ family antitoxin [Salmonella enterica subsp. enterica serovar Newport]